MKTVIRTVGRHMPYRIRDRVAKTLAMRVLFSPSPSTTMQYIARFLYSRKIRITFRQRLAILRRFLIIEKNIKCLHSFDELLIAACEILTFVQSAKGCIVEAGAYRGGGSAKLSIIAKACGRELYIFDSFEGLPQNNEPTANTTMGFSFEFNKGDYSANLDEVKRNIETYGEISACRFVKGWFHKTMPAFNKKIVTAYCDVDLESSNRACLKYLWPKIAPGGIFFSQDAHIPIVRRLFGSRVFWEKEIKQKPPLFTHITKRLGYFRKKQSKPSTIRNKRI